MESRSPSPPSLSPTPHLQQQPQPQSKRDKRRNALSDKLAHLTNSFHSPVDPQLRDHAYRTQLSSLQADMQLITRADVSGTDMQLVEDSSEAINGQVVNVLREGVVPPELIMEQGLAGRWYAGFLESVNEAMEARDAELTLLWHQQNARARSLAVQHTRSLVHAREEHRCLASTIQQRVSNRLKAQLKKLAAEKELSSQSANALSSLSAGSAYDMDGNSALHLHPSQFGLIGGVGSPRRHGMRDLDENLEKEPVTRRKPRRRGGGEVEELIALSSQMNFDPHGVNGKRKRRHGPSSVQGIDDIAEDMPMPMPMPMPTPPTGFEATNTPPPEPEISSEEQIIRRKRREELLKQVYAPTYSVEKLFTEKELQMHGNAATLATIRFFSERTDPDGDFGDPENGHDTPATGANTPAPGDDEEDDNGRAISPLSELTRGIPPLPGVNTRSNPPRQFGRDFDIGVPNVGVTYVNKAGIAPPPPGLRSEDAETDLAVLRRQIQNGAGEKRSGAGAEGGGGKKQKKS